MTNVDLGMSLFCLKTTPIDNELPSPAKLLLDYLVKKTFKERFQVSQHVRKLPPDLQKNNMSTNSWKIHKRI